MSKNAELREKHKWAIEKPKLDNARRLRGIYFIDLEDKEFKKSFKMQGEMWKHQWFQPCLARHARKTSMGRPVARPMISSLNLHVSWKPVNPQECVWKNLYRNIMMPQAMKIPAANAAVDKEWEKLAKIPAWDKTKVRNKSEVIDDARKEGRKVHFASVMDLCHLKECRIGDKAPKIQRSSCTPRRHCER